MSGWDFASMENGVAGWLRGLVGKDPMGTQVPVLERAAPQVQTPHGVHLLYAVTATQPVGHDWTKYEEDASLPDGEDYVPEQRGIRRFTLQLRLESINTKPGWSARNFLERVRMRLRRPSSRATMRSLGLAIERSEAITQLPDETNGERRLSAATLDIHMTLAVTEKDELGATSWIEKVSYTVTGKGPDGDPAGGTPITVKIT